MHLPWLNLTLATSITLSSLSLPLQAVQLSDGRVYFDQPPSLLDSATTRNRTNTSGGTYYFTVSLPDNAGEPLQQVAIAQRNPEGFARRVNFNLNRTFAFTGTRRDRGNPLPIGSTTWDETDSQVIVTFEPPVAPGQTVTIGLRPHRNPQLSGVYLFGITAFPEGELAHGQFLGFGRFHFYESDRPFPFSYRDRLWR